MSIFLTLGHGTDDITVDFNERKTLKKGFTLVTLAQCGVVASRDNVIPYMNAFTDESNYDLLRDPSAHRAELRTLGNSDIHVYKEGDHYPALDLHLFIDWESETANKVDVTKSGMYKFPVNQSEYVLSSDAEGDDKYFGKISTTGLFEKMIRNINQVKSMYKGSVFPTEDFIQSVYDKSKSLNHMKKATIFSLDHVFDILGEGVYYFVVCRSPKGIDLNTFIDEHIINKPDGFNNALDKITYIPKLLPSMEVLKQEAEMRRNRGEKPLWINNEYLAAPEKYGSLYTKVMATRSKSVEKQRGGTRRRRRHRRSNTYKYKGARRTISFRN